MYEMGRCTKLNFYNLDEVTVGIIDLLNLHYTMELHNV